MTLLPIFSLYVGLGFVIGYNSSKAFETILKMEKYKIWAN